ncbi:MAG: hypothetical protein KAG28_01450 [Cocleimonas sp.]|nr:hypothetical protein [Cocleimonas sp.]
MIEKKRGKLTLKRRKLTLKPRGTPAKKKPTPPPPPKKKKKKKKKSTEPALPVITKKTKADEMHAKLSERSEVWRTYLPLKLGMKQILVTAFPEYSKASVQYLIERHALMPEYLDNVLKYDIRFDLDGKEADEVVEKHKDYTEKTITKLANKVIEDEELRFKQVQDAIEQKKTDKAEAEVKVIEEAKVVKEDSVIEKTPKKKMSRLSLKRRPKK